MEFGEIDQRLDVALALLIERDKMLFDANVIETSISHKLGCYLQWLFPSYDVDCEYDRLGQDGKSAEYGPDMRPDVIIHKRGPGGPNLVAIELKPDARLDPDDEVKLMELTSLQGKYRYEYGFSIGFENEDGEKRPFKHAFCDGRFRSDLYSRRRT